MHLSKVVRQIGMVALTLFAAYALSFGRAGGAGGGSHSSSSHSSSHSSSSSHSYSHSSSSSGGSGSGDFGLFITVFIVIGVVIIIGSILQSGSQKKGGSTTSISDFSDAKPLDEAAGYKDFMKRYPDFNWQGFEAKVTTAFNEIQKAWSAQDLVSVRRFITDGVYQRFSTQFTMMGLLKQTNPLDNIEVLSVNAEAFRVDGAYDVIDARIYATMRDEFICEIDHSLDEGDSQEEFVEYWSFIRKRGAASAKDLYSAQRCPSCNADLTNNLGELAQCSYCNALVNSGEFDWVLAEITQQDDYFKTPDYTAGNMRVMERMLEQESETFSAQLLEDRASNGYLQIITAFAKRDIALARRFTTEECFKKLESLLPERQGIYNRLYLNSVILSGIRKEGERFFLYFTITRSSQCVAVNPTGGLQLLDPTIITNSEILVMCRNVSPSQNKGSLYMHQCPSCGANIQDTRAITCSYCNAAFNNLANEWVIADLMSMNEWRTFFESRRKELSNKIGPAQLDALYDVKEYALNNILVMFAADGVFAKEERAMAEEVAVSLKFKIAQLEPMFAMAKNGRLTIRMPEDTAQRKKVYDLMVKAASADNQVSPEEQTLLDYMQKTYLA
jgi:predicted lipid-binding transport protein (Tim44 family)